MNLMKWKVFLFNMWKLCCCYLLLSFHSKVLVLICKKALETNLFLISGVETRWISSYKFKFDRWLVGLTALSPHPCIHLEDTFAIIIFNHFFKVYRWRRRTIPYFRPTQFHVKQIIKKIYITHPKDIMQ